MTNSENIYEVEEHQREPGEARYFFLSEGKMPVAKVVQYAYIGVKVKRPVN
jgi:hypothetical protein